LGFSVGSNFLAACMGAPFELVYLIIVDAVQLEIVELDDVSADDFAKDIFGQMA